MAETKALPKLHKPGKEALTEILTRVSALEAQLEAEPAPRSTAMEQRERRIDDLATKIQGLDRPSARLLCRSLDSIDSLAMDIADLMEWEHGEDAVAKAEGIAGTSDWSPQALAEKFANAGPDLSIASAYLRVRELPQTIIERGELIYAIGALAEVARNLLGSVAEKRISEAHSASAAARWDKRRPVYEWLAEERRKHPDGEPGTFIGARLEELKARAEAAGSRLSGERASVIRTGKQWLKLALCAE